MGESEVHLYPLSGSGKPSDRARIQEIRHTPGGSAATRQSSRAAGRLDTYRLEMSHTGRTVTYLALKVTPWPHQLTICLSLVLSR